jgi:adenosylhomocysteine/aminodeoxyfutalosine nucleosidase
MKIALLGAMKEEVSLFLDFFAIAEQITIVNTIYYVSSYKDIEIVIATSNVGKVNAAIVTTLLIERFRVDMILFSGVAGAINTSLNIGDLMIGTHFVQHDLDITACGHPFGFAPKGAVFIESDKALREMVKHVASTQNIPLKEGIIATGDQFVSNRARKEWIAQSFHADALEMEGASIAAVCAMFEIPFCIIRAISDSAEHDAGSSYQQNMEKAATQSALLMISVVETLASDFHV